jgi:hypothetical protein
VTFGIFIRVHLTLRYTGPRFLVIAGNRFSAVRGPTSLAWVDLVRVKTLLDGRINRSWHRGSSQLLGWGSLGQSSFGLSPSSKVGGRVQRTLAAGGTWCRLTDLGHNVRRDRDAKIQCLPCKAMIPSGSLSKPTLMLRISYMPHKMGHGTPTRPDHPCGRVG